MSEKYEYVLSDEVKALVIIPQSNETEECDMNQSFLKITLSD